MTAPYTPVMPQPAVLARIRQRLQDLTPSEQAVAKLLLERPGEFVHWSIEETARHGGVSTASVQRLCRAVGFDGFRELKLALAADTATHALYPQEIRAGDSSAAVARQVFLADLQAIRDTLDLLDTHAFERAVTALAAARRIDTYGIGSSAPIAFDAYYRLLRLGLPATVATDAHVMAVAASLLQPGDAALVISHTGRTRETLTAAELARDAGATVVGITSHHDAPLRDACHVLLVTATAETAFRTEAMASRIAHLSMIDALYAALAARDLPRARETLEHTRQIIESKRLQDD